MTTPIRRRVAACAMVTCALTAGPAFATNGYFANGYGAASKGMAGAGVALSTDALGTAQNPALGASLGNQAEACVSVFAPDRSVEIAPGGPLTPGTHKSANDVFFIPCLGVNWMMNDGASLGLVLFGNGGMNTEYDPNFFAGFGAGSAPLGVNLEQAFISLTYSQRVNDRLTLGIAPTLAIQRFSATGLEAFAGMSQDPANVTNRGDDWSTGFGLNLGMVFEAAPGLTFGAAYRTRIDMEEFDRYAGLFAEQGDFDIPAMATIGVAFTPANQPELTLTAEYQRIFYGDIAAIANPNDPPQGPLGADGGLGFGWKDMDVIRVAAQYRANDRLTLRGGISHATDFIDEGSAVVNSLTPATPKWHVSVGGSLALSDRWGLTVAYTHAFSNSVEGSNPALTGVPQPVKLEMSQHELTAGLTYRW